MHFVSHGARLLQTQKGMGFTPTISELASDNKMETSKTAIPKKRKLDGME